MIKKAFTFVEVIIALLLISLLLLLVSSTTASMLSMEKRQEKIISGNEYINYLRKKALAYRNGLVVEDFFSGNTDLIADEFYEAYHEAKDYPHQTVAPTIETPIATNNVTVYIYHFHLLNSNDTLDQSTETIITFSPN